jgi:hypothetical protein
MGKVCVHCEKKVGMFKSMIDGAYCSYDCRNSAREALEESERQSHERIVEAQRKAAEAAEEHARLQAAAHAAHERRSRCPRCDSWWQVSGSSSAGVHSARCEKCLYTAEFASVVSCPSCRGESLVVTADGEARCPRCKYREHGRIPASA